MNINQINSVGNDVKEAIKIQDLPINVPQIIENIQIVNSQYGDVPLLELERVKVFLPNRSTSIIKKNLEHFISAKYQLVYKGSRQLKNKKLKPMQEFEIIEIPREE